MSIDTILGIWAGVATGGALGLAIVVRFLRNERNTYRRALNMGEPPRPTPFRSGPQDVPANKGRP